MNIEHIFYIILLVVAAISSLIISYMFYTKRKTPGAIPLSAIMLLAFFWTLQTIIILIIDNFVIKDLLSKSEYFCIVTIPVLWLILPIQYYGMSRFLNTKFILALFIIPSLTMFFVITDSHYHMIYTTPPTYIKIGTMYMMVRSFSLWFWVHAIYSYSILIIGTVLLLYRNIKMSKIYRLQSIVISLSALTPVIVNIANVTNIINMKVDPTPLTFTITGLLFFISLFHLKFLDLIPIARETVLENLSDLIIVSDFQNRIVDINRAALIFLREKKENVVGKDITTVFSEWNEHLIKYSGITSCKDSFSVKSLDGNVIFFRMTIAPIYNKKNSITGKYILLQDITELESAIRSLRVSQKEAQDANKAKSRFLANMSHEIRTPLNGIIGMSELLGMTNLNNEQKKYLKSIEYSASSLLEIIADILDFSKIEAGKMVLKNENFNIYATIDELMEALRYSVSHNVQLISNIEEGIPVMIKGDVSRLKQVLVNLLYNAIKFTEHGYIKLNVSILKIQTDTITLNFIISDTGSGISDEYMTNLFQSFSQFDTSNTRKHGGTGLGLAISKSIIESMGGTIICSSELNVGTTFTFNTVFNLNLDESSEVQNLQQENPEINILNKISSKGFKVLVVEDNKTNGMFIQNILKKKNIQVKMATNGAEAIKSYMEDKFNLILMDVQMPVMDGIDATRNIRELEKTLGYRTNIVALTANAFKEDMDSCIEAGMDDFLTKPIKWGKLLNTLKSCGLNTENEV